MSKVPLAPSSEHSSLCQMRPPYILLWNQRESPPHPLLDRRNVSISGNSTKPETQGEEQHEGMNQTEVMTVTHLHAHATLSGQDPRVPPMKTTYHSLEAAPRNISLSVCRRRYVLKKGLFGRPPFCSLSGKQAG